MGQQRVSGAVRAFVGRDSGEIIPQCPVASGLNLEMLRSHWLS